MADPHKALRQLSDEMYEETLGGDGFARAEVDEIERIVNVIKSNEFWIIEQAQSILGMTPTVGPGYANRIEEMKKEWLAWHPQPIEKER